MRLVHCTSMLRHGDRTPTFNCMEPFVRYAGQEAAAWAKALPTKEVQLDLQKRFPIENPHNSTRDERLGIFGSLTQLGVFQCYTLGRVMFGMWRSKGLFNHGEAPTPDKIRVMASNYKRTQQSAQAFLLGMFPNSQANPDPKLSVHVKVPQFDAALNIWGRDKKLFELVRKRVSNCTALQKVEQLPEVYETRSMLTSIVPVFANFLRSFSWTDVVDHFQCRASRASAKYCIERNRKLKAQRPKHSTVTQLSPPISGMEAFTDSSKVLELFNETYTRKLQRMTTEDVKLFLEKNLGVILSGSPSDTLDFFRVLDTDGDGTIDVDEFADFMSRSETAYNDYPDHHSLPNWQHHAVVSEQVLCWQFQSLFEDKAIMRAACGPFLDLVVFPIQDALTSGNPFPKVRVCATHDVTLLPFLYLLKQWENPINLKISNANWVGLASSIHLEIYEVGPEKTYYIKVLISNGFRANYRGDFEEEPWTCPSTKVELVPIPLDFVSSKNAIENDTMIPLEEFMCWIRDQFAL